MAYPYQNTYPYVPAMPDRLAQLQYQQMQQVPQMPQIPQAQMPQQNNGILWVSGEIGAKSYLVAPGTTVMLMDSESQKFYIKSSDMAGMPTLKTFEYKEIFSNAPQSTQTASEDLDNRFVTRQEYNEMRAQYEAILQKLNELSTEPKQTKVRKAVSEDE